LGGAGARLGARGEHLGEALDAAGRDELLARPLDAAERAHKDGSRAALLWEMDETCPVSTGGGTRRVQLVREGRGGGGGVLARAEQRHEQRRVQARRQPPHAPARAAPAGAGSAADFLGPREG